jgi:hypothetical protein
MMENFRGCRVLAYCVMCNHFHILHEVPPKLKTPLSDEQLLKRLGALYLKAFVVNLAKELAAARKEASEGRARDGEAHVQRIHERFTYRMLLLEAGEEKAPEVVNEEGEQVMEMVRKGMRREGTVCSFHGLEQVVPATGHVSIGRMLRWKVRYFTDGAAIGSRAFVDVLFEQCRERFGPKRKSGARKMRGRAAGAVDVLWSARDLCSRGSASRSNRQRQNQITDIDDGRWSSLGSPQPHKKFLNQWGRICKRGPEPKAGADRCLRDPQAERFAVYHVIAAAK